MHKLTYTHTHTRHSHTHTPPTHAHATHTHTHTHPHTYHTSEPECPRSGLCLQSDELTPQVIQSAKIVLMNPGNQASQEHFELLKKQWLDNMEKLRDLVDEATDTAAFIKAQGEQQMGAERVREDRDSCC